MALGGGHRVTLLGTEVENAQPLAGALSGDVHADTVGDPATGEIVVLAVWCPVVGDVLSTYGDQLDARS